MKRSLPASLLVRTNASAIKYLLHFSLLFFAVTTQAQVLSADPDVISGCSNTYIDYEFSYSAGSIWDLSWEIYPPEAGTLYASSYPQTTATVNWYGDGQIIANYTAYNNDWQEVDQSSIEYYFTETDTYPGTISIPGPLTRCYSASGSFSITGNSNTPTWQKCASSTCPTNSDTNWSTTSSSFTNLTGTTKFRAKVSTACGTAYSNIITITIHPEFTEGSIYVGNGQSFCHNQPIEITSVENSAGGDGPTTYQWQVSQGGSFYDIAGADQAEHTIPSSSIPPGSTFTYRRLAKGTLCPGDWMTSNSVNVSAYGVLQPGALPGGSTICTGTSPPLIAETAPPTGGGAEYSYVWQSSDNGTSNWSSTLSTAASYDPGPIISARKYYRRTVTSSCGTSTSAMTYFDVYATSAGTITGPGNSCYNGSGNLGVSGNSGAVTWQKCTSGCSTTDDTGWSTSTSSFSNLTTTTKFRAKLNDSSCGVKYSNSIETIVAQPFYEGTINPGGAFCPNGTFTISSNQNSAGGQGTISYQWQYNTGSGFVNISGATQASYTIPVGQVPVNTTYSYRRGAKSTCESNFLYTASVNATTISPSIGGTALSVSANAGSNTVYGSAFGATKLVGNTGNVLEWQYSSSNTTGSYQSWGQAGLTTTTQTCCIGSPEQTIWIRAAVQNSICAVAYSSPASYYWQPTPPVVNAGADKTIYDTESSVNLTGSASGGNGNIASYAWSKISGPQATLSNTSTSTLQVSDFVAGSYVFRLSVTDAYNYTSHDDITLTVAIANNYNYIKESVILAEGISEQNIESLSSTMKSVKTTYYDGLGRPMQIVNWQSTPSLKDLVLPVKYDAFGREAVKYLPYSSSENNGWYKENALRDPLESVTGELEEYRTGKQFEFYQTGNTISTDPYPYAETIFESSPLNRVNKQGAPGETWQPNNDDYSLNDHTVKFRYETNGEDEVLLWRYDYATNLVSAKPGIEYEYYEPGALYVNKRYDENGDLTENGNLTIEYKDKEGRVVLKRVQVTENPSPVDHENYASTYYIYDDFGNLVTVLPPEASKAYATYHGYSAANKETFLKNLAFRYRYDGRKRMSQKWVPGAGVVYLVYDSRDRLVLTQDAVQRATSPYKWAFTKYDELNRPVLTGIKDTVANLLQSEMQTVVNTFCAKPGRKWGEKLGGPIHGHTNDTYPKVTSGTTIPYYTYLTVTYYDSYDCKNYLFGEYEYKDENLSQTVPNQATYTQPDAADMRVIGRVAATSVRVMDGTLSGGYTWLATVNYYDDRARLIQTVSDNYKGGFDRTTNLYDFSGKVLMSKKTHYGLAFKDLVGTTSVVKKIHKPSGTNAWNAGAASVQTLPPNEDGWVEFVAPATNKAMMIGFSETNPDANWNQIKYALYLKNNATVEVRENGSANLLSPTPPYAAGDVFRIERKAGKINYYKNGTLLLQRNASLNALLIDLSLNTAGGAFHSLRSSFGSFTARTITQTFEYHGGRLVNSFHQIDAGPNILLAHNEYNELGQLIDKKLHSTTPAATDARQSVDYRYNIRGWMTSMNNADLTVTASNDDSNDYFGFELEYNDATDVGNDAMFNGNISAMKWSSNLGGSPAKAYTYYYDPMNRITGAMYKLKNPTWTTATNSAFSESDYSYDLNGNIMGLKRHGEAGSAAIMDNLVYDYGTGVSRSNQLLKVSEMTVTEPGDKFKGFIDGTNTGSDYTYDANGNIITDQNKGITSNISHNQLNLPVTVTKGGNKIDYIYDGSGRKLAQVVTFTGIMKETNYSGEFTYENDALQFISHPEGRVVTTENETVAEYHGEATSGVTAYNSTLALATLNGGETYLKVTANGTVSQTGVFPIGGTTVVQSGERYRIRAKGYRNGGNAVHLIIKINGLHFAWPGASFPSSAASESWVEQDITIPAGSTAMQAGVTWGNTVAAGQIYYINEFQIIKLSDQSQPEYQYNLKDHLGNVRLTFTTKPDQNESVATLETTNEASEQAEFINYEEAIKINYDIFDHTYNGTTGDTYYSTRLTGGNTNAIFGLAKSLSVMPGDTISMEVYAKYLDPDSQNWTPMLTNFMAAVATGTAPPGTVVDGGGPGSVGSGTFPYSEFFNHANEGGTAPKAYLNFIVFDRDYNPIIGESGFIRITSAAKENGTNVAHEKLERSQPLVIKEPGYVYIYLSNENETPVEVFFDDFRVEHVKSPVVQVDDYYPFGLTFNSYRRENSVPNMYQYNGKERQEDLALGWLDYGARMYMPDIGRWGVIDPASHKYCDNSPYNYVSNNPVNNIDPDGREIEVVRKKKNLFRKQDVIKIKVTGVLINNSGTKMTRREMRDARNRLENGIKQAYTGQGATVKWKGSAKIRVGNEASLKGSDHAFRLYDDGKLPDSSRPGGFRPAGVIGHAPPKERVVELSTYLLSTPVGGRVSVERTGAHETGHSGNMHQEKGVFEGHPDPSSRGGNLMHQSSNPSAGFNLDEDQVLQLESDSNKGLLIGGRQIIK